VAAADRDPAATAAEAGLGRARRAVRGRERPAQADRYGALERSAIYGLLRRFFRDVANEAATREGAPPAAEFTRASTHWLRHTFANEAIKQMQPQVLQSLLGHSDLRVTSVYVKAQAADLVRGMS
jgi:site-specific recombinase XerD